MRDIKEIEARYEHRKNTKGKINLFKKRYIIIAILLVAIITNPSKERHKDKVIQRVEAAMGTVVYPSTTEGLKNDPFLDKIVDSYIKYSNYFLFSTTSVKFQGHSQTIGFGMFGFVYIPEKLEEVVKNSRL